MKPTLQAIAARALIAKPANEHRFGSTDQFASIPAQRRAALEKLGTLLSQELDDHLVEALQRHLKRPIAGPDELKALAGQTCAVPTEHEGEAGETWFLGTVQLLWVGAVHTVEVDGKLRAGREYRHLLPEAPA